MPTAERPTRGAWKTAGPAPAKLRRRLRVAFILYRDDLNVGGSLRVVDVLAHALDPARVEVHLIFTYGGPGPVARRAKVPCHFLNSRGAHDLSGWIRARRTIAKLDPDVLHFHNPVYWLHAALVGRPYKKLIHMHGPYFTATMRPLVRLLMAQTRRLADAVVCITRGMRQSVLDLGWGAPNQTWTVYNGIDCAAPESAPDRAEARASLGLPQDCRIIGVVCRLAWYKGCQDAVRILARLDRNWHLLFCGDGPMQAYLSDVARQEGVSRRVHFAGNLEDMRPAYAAMDAFLFLSKLEPFGLVIAEAMAARVPVFGLAAEGEYRDPFYPLVTPDNSVFVERTSPGDYSSPEPAPVLDELAAHINDFGTHGKAYQPMIDRAREWVFSRFHAKVQAEAMLEVYDLVTGRPTDSPK
jgi:glycosyltransferase involved in cell wall biosynthesis